MEFKISTQQILKVLYIFSWIFFIGVSINAGGFITNMIFTLFINPIGAHNFWQGNDLSSLYDYDKGYFAVVTFLMCIVALMKAIMFYLIIKILHDNKLNHINPYNNDVLRFIFNIAYLTFGISIMSHFGSNHVKWFREKGLQMPDVSNLNMDGADVWIFMSITLFVIAQIFKKGIELQEENNLTI